MKTVTACLLVVGFLLTAAGPPPGAAGEKQPAPKPKPKFTVGKDTTYVTGPLTKDGFVDYVTALNEQLGKSVKPADNAVVLLCEVFGPRPEGALMPGKFYQFLGAKEPPEKGTYLLSFGRYLKDEMQIKPGQALNDLLDEQDLTSQRPWTAKQYPLVASWLKFNEKPINLALEATKRKQYYYPLVPSDGDTSGLMGCLIPGVQKCRELASALTARAMLATAEGRHDDAWQDLLATHRLARLVAKGGSLIEALVGIALNQIASAADVAYLDVAKLSAKQIKDRLSDLQQLPPMPPVADNVDLTERLSLLDTVMTFPREGIKGFDSLVGGKGAGTLDAKVQQVFAKIDWDPALRTANKWYDRLVAAMREKDLDVREKKLDEFEADLKALKKKLDAVGPLTLGLMNSKDQGQLIGDTVVTLLIPAVRKVQQAADRNLQVERNLHVAFALVAYQADHKAYPKKLEALAPVYLKAIPQDLFSGKSLIYRPSEQGFLLYSVGVNRKDEDGRWYDDNPPGDDPNVRLPVPKLKKN